MTAFRGPLRYTRPSHIFDQLPFDLSEVFSREYMYEIVGGGRPWYGPAAAGSAGGWTLTDVGSGSSTLLMGNDGKLVLTGGTTDEDNSGLQFKGLPFRYSTTRDIVFAARVALSTAATSDAFIGLAAVDTSLISASALAVDDVIGFFKAATATDYTFNSRKNTTSTTQAMGLTLTDAAYALLGFTIKGGVIRAFAALDPDDKVNSSDTLFGSGSAVAATNAPDDIDVLLTFMVGQEGGTTARTLTVDWAFAAQELP